MQPSSSPSFVRRSGPLAATLLLPVLLSGCFTTALWGAGDDEAEAWSVAADGDDGWGDILARLALTPFALVLDCLTSPVQACLDGDDEPRQRRQPCPTRRIR